MPPKKAGPPSSPPHPELLLLPTTSNSLSFFSQKGLTEKAFVKPQPAAKKAKKPASGTAPVSHPPPKSSFFKPGGQKGATTTAAFASHSPFPKKNSFFNPHHPATAITTNTTTGYSSRNTSLFPRRSFLYDKHTEEPYAEWIGNEAVCLETGEVLFVSKRENNEEEDDDGTFGSTTTTTYFKHDFTPPAHKHPKDPSIVSQDLIDKGILTLDDFLTGNAGLTAEAYKKYMEILLLRPAATTTAVRG